MSKKWRKKVNLVRDHNNMYQIKKYIMVPPKQAGHFVVKIKWSVSIAYYNYIRPWIRYTPLMLQWLICGFFAKKTSRHVARESDAINQKYYNESVDSKLLSLFVWIRFQSQAVPPIQVLSARVCLISVTRPRLKYQALIVPSKEIWHFLYRKVDLLGT